MCCGLLHDPGYEAVVSATCGSRGTLTQQLSRVLLGLTPKKSSKLGSKQESMDSKKQAWGISPAQALAQHPGRVVLSHIPRWISKDHHPQTVTQTSLSGDGWDAMYSLHVHTRAHTSLKIFQTQLSPNVRALRHHAPPVTPPPPTTPPPQPSMKTGNSKQKLMVPRQHMCARHLLQNNSPSLREYTLDGAPPTQGVHRELATGLGHTSWALQLRTSGAHN